MEFTCDNSAFEYEKNRLSLAKPTEMTGYGYAKLSGPNIFHGHQSVNIFVFVCSQFAFIARENCVNYYC